jgi:hypothetical protein
MQKSDRETLKSYANEITLLHRLRGRDGIITLVNSDFDEKEGVIHIVSLNINLREQKFILKFLIDNGIWRYRPEGPVRERAKGRRGESRSQLHQAHMAADATSSGCHSRRENHTR